MPKRVRLDDDDIALARMLTRKRCEYRRYHQRTDQWGRGLIDGAEAVYVGFMGEIAFAKWASRTLGQLIQVDEGNRLTGDRGIDFMLGAWGIQVKTAKARYAETLVRTDEWATASWGIIVRAQWPSRRRLGAGADLFGDGPKLDRMTCDLCGWLFNQEFWTNATIVPARIGEHNNYSLPPERLKPMNDLAALLGAKQELVGGTL